MLDPPLSPDPLGAIKYEPLQTKPKLYVYGNDCNNTLLVLIVMQTILLANKILYLMYNLKETGRRGEFSDGNESEGFMKATNLSDQEVQDTTQDHDASANLITK